MGRGYSRLWRQNCLEVALNGERTMIHRFRGMEVDENSAAGRYENEGKASLLLLAFPKK